MKTSPWIQASGTSLIVVRGRAKTEINGIALPDSAQKASRWGKILSRGPLVTRVDPKATVVYFNPAMVTPGFDDRGNTLFDIIDEEAVCAEANDDFAAVANLHFDMPSLDQLIQALTPGRADREAIQKVS